MPKHSEGEWKFSKEFGRVETEKEVIAYIAGGVKPDFETAFANGRLIAAAPELLEICHGMTAREFWTTHEDDCDCAACEAYKRFIGSATVVKLVAAIRKAKEIS